MRNTRLPRPIVAVGHGPNGLLAVATDRALVLMDADLEVKSTVESGSIVAAGFSLDGRQAVLARGQNPSSVDLIDLPGGGVVRELPLLPEDVGAVTFHPDHSTYLVVGRDGLTVWREGRRSAVRRFEEAARPWPSRWSAVAVEDYGRLAMAGGERLVVMNGARWKSVHELKVEPSPTCWRDVVFNSDGEHMAAISELGLHVFGRGRSPVFVSMRDALCLAWLDERSLAVGARSGVQVWRVDAPDVLEHRCDGPANLLFPTSSGLLVVGDDGALWHADIHLGR